MAYSGLIGDHFYSISVILTSATTGSLAVAIILMVNQYVIFNYLIFCISGADILFIDCRPQCFGDYLVLFKYMFMDRPVDL